jgi:deoxynucleotide monophosphate kinase-like protein
MLVGLNGFKGSGKDTVGEYLNKSYGFERLSFAAKLKESAAALFDIDPILWEGWKNDPNARVELVMAGNGGKLLPNTRPITIREFLQRYGTEAHRSVFGADFWVDYALKGVDPNKNFVFTDARFENELSRIKSLGGYNVQILRPELINKDNHASEVPPPLTLIDYQIDNIGDFEDLYDRVDEFMEFLKFESYVSY